MDYRVHQLGWPATLRTLLRKNGSVAWNKVTPNVHYQLAYNRFEAKL